MITIERQNQILELLKKEKYCKVNKLCKKLFLSEATIRRDIKELTEKGLVVRYRGGVTLPDTNNKAELKFEIRNNTKILEKRKIAEIASTILKPNISIYLDNGTTIVNFCPFVNQVNNLIITTNGLETAKALLFNDTNRVIIPSGSLLKESCAIIGGPAIEFIKSLSFDVAFFSCSGLTIDGSYETLIENRDAKFAAMEQAKVKVLLVDDSKFGKKKTFKTCDLSMYDYIITNKKPDEKFINGISNIKTKLIIK